MQQLIPWSKNLAVFTFQANTFEAPWRVISVCQKDSYTHTLFNGLH